MKPVAASQLHRAYAVGDTQSEPDATVTLTRSILMLRAEVTRQPALALAVPLEAGTMAEPPEAEGLKAHC